jgi:hypothetical protein
MHLLLPYLILPTYKAWRGKSGNLQNVDAMDELAQGRGKIPHRSSTAKQEGYKEYRI